MTNWVVKGVLCSIALRLGNGVHATSSSPLSFSRPVHDLTDYQTSQVGLWTSKPFSDWVIQYRGGQRWSDGDDNDSDDRIDDDYDDAYNHDDDEDEEEDDDETMDQRPSKPTSIPKVPRSQGQITNGRPNSRPNNPNRQPIPSSSRRRLQRPKHWTQRMASQGFKVGSQLAWGAVQQTGNVAYQLIKPRHVDVAELLGLWRMDQQIVLNGADLASVATIEMDPRQRLLTLKLPNGKTIVEPFTFQKTRLGSYQTEFVIPAFLVGDTPRLYGYRGTWQRKLADQRVIKLVGKIYKVKQQRFGKSKGKYIFSQSIGTFVARRRMKLIQDDDDDEVSDNDSAGENDQQDVGDEHNEYDDEDYDGE